jgi:hypothetical protein
MLLHVPHEAASPGVDDALRQGFLHFVWSGICSSCAYTKKCAGTCSPNHMCCYQTLWTLNSVSASPMRILLWHSLVNFFGALAGLCHFLGIATSYVIGKACKESNQKAGKTQESSPSPSPFLHDSPRTRKRKVHVNAAVSGTHVPSLLATQMYHIEVQMPPWFGMGINFSTSTG